MNELQETYNKRSTKKLNNSILWLRWEYYKYVIIPVIKEFIKQTSADRASVLYGKIIERGSGQGHKMLKTVQWLLWNNFDFIGIEPSQGMRNIAETKFKDDNRVSFIDGFAENLPLDDQSIDFIFDIQMQHHHPKEKKKEMITEAHRVLKQNGCIYILDTFIPPGTSLISSIQQKVFDIVQWIYIDKVWKWEYYNGYLQDTMNLLEAEWFEINQQYSRGFKVCLGHILGFDFVNQIIARKK